MNLNEEIDRVQEALTRAGSLIADVRTSAAAGDDKEAANLKMRLKICRAELAAHEETLRDMTADEETPDITREIIHQNLTTLAGEITALDDVEQALSRLLHAQSGSALTDHAARLYKLKSALQSEAETSE